MTQQSNSQNNQNAHTRRQNKSGMALIGAIAMLAIFVMLGTAYVRYMTIELEKSRDTLNRLRVESLARGGIYAAIGEIESTLAGSGSIKPTYTIKTNIYRLQGNERSAHPQRITVSVSDESSLINLNHAPAEVLAALGMDQNALKKLQKALPTRTGQDTKSRAWLTNTDDLLTRNIVTRRQFDAIHTQALTTYTTEDPNRPAHYINLNAATPQVLGAVLAIDDPTELDTLIATRPFQSWEDLVAKTGREPTTFNVKSPRYATREMPIELTLQSRCFRLHSEVSLNAPGTGGRTLTARTEAVVLFKEDGTYTIRYWTQFPNREPQPTTRNETNESTEQADPEEQTDQTAS